MNIQSSLAQLFSDCCDDKSCTRSCYFYWNRSRTISKKIALLSTEMQQQTCASTWINNNKSDELIQIIRIIKLLMESRLEIETVQQVLCRLSVRTIFRSDKDWTLIHFGQFPPFRLKTGAFQAIKLQQRPSGGRKGSLMCTRVELEWTQRLLSEFLKG